MNSSTSCGCGGTAVASPCSCAGAGCSSCQAQGYVRPRFFAGQLLTEEDLQALSDYVVNKNRLHNRHFLGDGVVCGLAVGCNPCGGGKLVVQPGHALDCCGNDLVLECAVELDANAMVRDLRRKQLGADCGDPCAEPKAAASNQPPAPARHYCLYLRYGEEATDPVAPYATDEPCGPAGCEATRIREGVRFELRCDTGMPKTTDGFAQRVLACLSDLTRASDLTKLIARMYAAGATGDDVAAARNALLDRLDGAPQLADCLLRAEVATIAIPPKGADIAPARTRVFRGFLRMVRDCICRAILPPCPPCDDSGVLLACISMADCQVTSICNLERKFILTGPNLRYWIPFDQIGDLFERLCCAELVVREPTPPPPPPPPPPGAEPAPAPQGFAFAAANAPGRDIDTDALLKMVSDHLLASFGLQKNDAEQLRAIARDMRSIFEAGGFDGVLPARVLHHLGGSDVKEALSGQMVDSAAFRDAASALDQQHVARLEETRKQLQADYQGSVATLASQNQDLRAQLDAVLERVANLESRPAPGGDNEVVKKTRK